MRNASLKHIGQEFVGMNGWVRVFVVVEEGEGEETAGGIAGEGNLAMAIRMRVRMVKNRKLMCRFWCASFE